MTESILLPRDILVPALDFGPAETSNQNLTYYVNTQKEVLKVAREISGLVRCVKVGSVIRGHYELIGELHDLGFQVFADLKLVDIPETMKRDAEELRRYRPEYLTVLCNAPVDGVTAVRIALQDTGITKVLGVTALSTTAHGVECKRMYGHSSLKSVVQNHTIFAENHRLYGIVVPSSQLAIVRNTSSLLFKTAVGVRPEWAKITKDHQVEPTTPEIAYKNGADMIIVGRPITEACENDVGSPKSPAKAIEIVLEELQKAKERWG